MQGGNYFITGSSFSISAPIHTSFMKTVSFVNFRSDGIVTQSYQSTTSTSSYNIPTNYSVEKAERVLDAIPIPVNAMYETFLTLTDGRTLQLLVGTCESDHVVILHHGTPSCCLSWVNEIAYFNSIGIKAIAYSRAGYFKSSRKLGRRVIDNNTDIAQIVAHFNIASFTAIGWSGGGPHALANALLSQCKSVVVLAGVGMWDMIITKQPPPSTTFLTGMGQENIDEFTAAAEGMATLVAYININGPPLQTITPDELENIHDTLFSPHDQLLLQDPVYATMVATDIQSALSDGFSGWIDDDLEFVNNWGFSLSQIGVPVAIFQGDDDRMVPQSHSIWIQSHITPQPSLTIIPEYGHLGLFDFGRDQIVALIRSTSI